MKSWSEHIVLSLSIFLGVCVFGYWFFHNPVNDFQVAVPGMDNRPSGGPASGDSVSIGEIFRSYLSSYTSTLNGKWPNFRGRDHDNIDKETIRLIDHWPSGGPIILWRKELGEGHAAASIYNGRVYILDYDERKKNDILRCLSLRDGTELWHRGYTIDIKRNHGMSRTIPAVNDKYVVTMGPMCQVMCCDAITGDLLWGIDLVMEFNTTVPLWYTGQCPLIEDNVAVIAPGGSVLMIGVDCATGRIVWQTPNPESLKMSHSSIVPMTIENKKIFVYNALGGLCGVSAEKSDAGKLLWLSKEFTPSVIAPSPVYVGQNRIFVTAGYGAGSALFQIHREGEIFSATMLQSYKPSQGLASEQQTPIFRDGQLFSIQPKDAGTSRNQFVSSRPDDLNNLLWTSSKTERFGLGPYIIADNKFLILSDNGEITIARYKTTGFEILDKAQIIDGQDAWGPFALADGYLVMRDSKNMVCLDMRAP